MIETISTQIKQTLTVAQVAEFYGFTPNRGGFIQCPFHTGDNHGSLKLYPGSRGWYCFGCNEGGTVIDFVMKLFAISFREAVQRISADFGLDLTHYEPDMKAHSAVLELRKKETSEKEKRDAEILALSAEYRKYHEISKLHQPRQMEDGTILFHPLYAEAVKALPVLEEKINELEGRG